MGEISDIVNEVVSDLLEEKGKSHPEQLNNGDCPTVAKRITDRVPEAERVTGMTVFGRDRAHYPAHTWVEYNGLCYDAECTHGTPNWHDLPIFTRECLPIDRRHVKERYRTGELEEHEWADKHV